MVVLTGATSVEEIQKCMRAGLVDFLSKPIDSEVLFKMLELLLGYENVK